MHIDLTWSLFTTPLFIFALGIYMHYREKRRDQHEVEVKRLLDRIGKGEEESAHRWECEVKENFRELKETTKKISDEVSDRVVYEHCNDRMDKLDVRVRVLGG